MSNFMEMRKMMGCVIYHGSPEISEKPQVGKGKTYNDYGKSGRALKKQTAL